MRAAWPGYVVELGKREIDTEIFAVIGQQLGQLVERVAPLLALARRRDDADFGSVVGHRAQPVEVAEPEEQQVGRHLGRRLENHLLAPLSDRGGAGDRHVADCHQFFGHDRGQVERRLVTRLVECRGETPRVGRLELREQAAHILAGARIGIVEREQAVGLRVDGSGIVGFEPVAPGGKGFVRSEGGRLPVCVRCDLQAHGRAAVGGEQDRVCYVEIVRVQRDRATGLEQFEVDCARRSKGEPFKIGGHGDGVVRRSGVAWQVAGNRIG